MKDFHDLILELGELLEISLEVDKHNACKIHFVGDAIVQIEPDVRTDYLLIASFVGEISAGKYRERIFASALKYNGLFPRLGTFGYSQRNNQLALFEYFPFKDLRADQLLTFLNGFVSIARDWKANLSSGNIPSVEATISSPNPSIFNLKQIT